MFIRSLVSGNNYCLLLSPIHVVVLAGLGPIGLKSLINCFVGNVVVKNEDDRIPHMDIELDGRIIRVLFDIRTCYYNYSIIYSLN